MANISTDSSMKFNMPGSNVQLNAVYTNNKYYVSVTESMGGAYTGTGEGSYSVGDTVTLDASQAPPMQSFGWWESSGDVNIEDQTNPILTFTMPDHNVDLYVTYQYR